MKIIIVGAGKVGEYLFTDLNIEDNDIVLIEKNKKYWMRCYLNMILWEFLEAEQTMRF